jgi:hypothetical protein
VPASVVERYNAYRAQIEHESNLIGVRLGWLIAAEAFLVVAFATVLTVTNGDRVPANFKSQAQHLFDALPIAGIALAAVMGVSILAALRAMNKLRREYGDLPEADKPDGFPEITVASRIYFAGGAAPFLVPVLTVAGWLYVILD